MAGNPQAPFEAWTNEPGRTEFARLIDAEEFFSIPEDYCKDETLAFARRKAVQFVEKNWKGRNADAVIPYLAITYYDLVVTQCRILPPVVTGLNMNLHLCLLCCLSIAAKLRDKTFKLSNFLNQGQYKFTVKQALAMEVGICNRLNWRMRILTPFCFVEYLIPLLIQQPASTSSCLPVYRLLVTSQFEIAFTEHRPSVVAASAILIVSSKLYSDRHAEFETRIMNSEFFAPFKDMIQKCKRQLQRVWDPSMSVVENTRPASGQGPRLVAHGEASSLVERRASGPGETSSAAGEERSRRPGKEPVVGTSLVEEQEPLISQEELIQHGGRSAASSEIGPAEPEDSDEDNADQVFNFELGWAQAQKDAVDRMFSIRYVLLDCCYSCCSGIRQRCNIL